MRFQLLADAQLWLEILPGTVTFPDDSVRSHTEVTLHFFSQGATRTPRGGQRPDGSAPYLPGFAGDGDAAVLVVLDRRPSFLHQGPVAGAGVKRRHPGPAGADPLCKRALRGSKRGRGPGSEHPSHGDTATTALQTLRL